MPQKPQTPFPFDPSHPDREGAAPPTTPPASPRSPSSASRPPTSASALETWRGGGALGDLPPSAPESSPPAAPKTGTPTQPPTRRPKPEDYGVQVLEEDVRYQRDPALETPMILRMVLVGIVLTVVGILVATYLVKKLG